MLWLIIQSWLVLSLASTTSPPNNINSNTRDGGISRDSEPQKLDPEEQLTNLLEGLDWKHELCEGWTLGQITGDEKARQLYKKIRQNERNKININPLKSHSPAFLDSITDKVDAILEQVLALLKGRAENSRYEGSLTEYDCLLHHIALLSDPNKMTFMSKRATELFAAGHFYEATMLKLITRTPVWTPFGALDTPTNPESIVRGDARGYHRLLDDDYQGKDIWPLLQDGLDTFHENFGKLALSSPVLAEAQARELAKYCNLPAEWNGHPDKISLQEIPRKVTVAWFNSCLAKALPDFLNVDDFFLDKVSMKGQTLLHQVALYGDGLELPQPIKLLTKLMDAGADPRRADAHGFNALHLATLWASRSTIQQLYDYKDGKYWRDLSNSIDEYGRTPHQVACNATWVVNALGKETMNLIGGECKVQTIHPAQKHPTYLCTGMKNDDQENMATPCPSMDLNDFQQKFYNLDECDISVVDAQIMTPETFIRDFVSVQRPVLVRRAFNPSTSPLSNKNFFSDPSVSRIVFEKTSIPDPQVYGRKPTGSIKLGDFAQLCMGDARSVDNRTCSLDGYGFVPLSIQELAGQQVPWKQFRDIFKESLPGFAAFTFDAPADGNPPHLDCPQLSLGPARGGSNMHTSNMEHTLLMDGIRNWWILPPMLAFNGNQYPTQFRDEGVETKDGLLQCTQRPGDLLFLPHQWGRGHINLASSVAYTCEFEWIYWHTAFVLPVVKSSGATSEDANKDSTPTSPKLAEENINKQEKVPADPRGPPNMPRPYIPQSPPKTNPQPPQKTPPMQDQQKVQGQRNKPVNSVPTGPNNVHGNQPTWRNGGPNPGQNQAAQGGVRMAPTSVYRR